MIWLAPFLLTGLSLAATPANQPQEMQPFHLSDFRGLVSLNSPRLSPDGKWVAIIRSTPDFVANKHINSIFLVDTTTGKIRQVTDGKIAVSSPRWSPGGTQLAYISSGANKSDQVFAIAPSGGVARQITHAKHDVEEFSWSPDGKQLAYVTQDDDPNDAAIKRHDDLFEVQNDGYLIQSVAVPSHLWLVSSQGGAGRRLTHGNWSVLQNASPFVGGPSDPSWSSDGNQITFAQQANAHNGDGDLSTVAVVDVSTGAVKRIGDRTDYEYQPAFSRSGNAVAYIRPHGPTSLSIMDLCIATTDGTQKQSFDTLDRDVVDFGWMPDGQSLIAVANDKVQTCLWLLRKGEAARKLNTGDLSVMEASVGATGAIAEIASGGSMPAELYIQTNPTAMPRRLTNFNGSLQDRRYGKVTEYEWTSPDGEKCDGVLTYPVGYTQGKSYPLVVTIHGGPEAASTVQFDDNWLRQPLAGEGYLVFQPNYRGSDNLGNAHEHAIYRDPGIGPAADVLSGIDSLVATGMVNPNRISIAGHSYGGFMSAWLLGHDHRWRSGIVSDGLTDWRDLYYLSASSNQSMARDSLGGTPSDEQSAELYRTGSPITYADHITTPTLILHGTADETVPITESYALFHTIKDHKVPVKFIAVPGAHHHPDDPVRNERFYEIMKAWIQQHDR